MALRYFEYLTNCPDQPCPNQDAFAPRQLVAFRFMHSPATEERDFAPPAIIDGVKRRDRCGRFALSFFETLEAALRRYARLAERVDAGSRYGSHIGEIALAETDGLMSVPDAASRHVDLHPNEGVTFVPRVTKYHAA